MQNYIRCSFYSTQGTSKDNAIIVDEFESPEYDRDVITVQGSPLKVLKADKYRYALYS